METDEAEIISLLELPPRNERGDQVRSSSEPVFSPFAAELQTKPRQAATAKDRNDLILSGFIALDVGAGGMPLPVIRRLPVSAARLS